MPAWPDVLNINAWTGEFAGSATPDEATERWARGQPTSPVGAITLEGSPIYPDPTDPLVGWGLVLRDDDGLSLDEKAGAEDAPVALRRLLDARKGVVLRYRPGEIDVLYRYSVGGEVRPVPMIGSDPGTRPGRMPRYLLLYGPPDEGKPGGISWGLQFLASAVRYTGRLDLTGDALDNYVKHAIDIWPREREVDPTTLVWSAVHDTEDITGLMARTIGQKVKRGLRQWSSTASVTFLDGRRRFEEGGVPALQEALARLRPRVVVTTSHGKTGPLSPDRSAQMRAEMGLLVDVDHKLLRPADLSDAFPAGAIWYAHACCSAGSVQNSGYEGAVAPASKAGRIIAAAARTGSYVSPFPKALLSAEHPIRAFVGHVEPTFDLSLRNRRYDLPITAALVGCLTGPLQLGQPVGPAFERAHDVGPSYRTAWRMALRRYGDRGEQGALTDMLQLRLAAYDNESLVILGDPAVRLGSS